MPERVELPVGLRLAEERDCQLLWELRNDPQTRASSFQTEVIPLEDHQRWFSKALVSADTRIFVVQEPSGRSIGYVRFYFRDGNAEVSVSIEPGSRGKGLGAEAVRMASDRLLSEDGIQRVVAYIKPANSASVQAFQRAGFTEAGLRRIEEMDILEMVYPRSRP